MLYRRIKSIAAAVIICAMGACGSPPRILEQITITSPAAPRDNPSALVMVAIPPDGKIPVSFTVQNLTLMPSGSCPTTANCGQLILRAGRFSGGGAGSSAIFDDACDQQLRAGTRYNATGASSPIAFDLSQCNPKNLSGDFVDIRLMLIDDSGRPGVDAMNQYVYADTSIMLH